MAVPDSLEGPGVAVAVRLEVLRSQYGRGLEHLHEHHVTHHPQQTCVDGQGDTSPSWKTLTRLRGHARCVFTVSRVYAVNERGHLLTGPGVS